MSIRNLFASILMACLPAVGLGGLAPVANAASAGQSFLNPGESARNNVIEIKYRDRGHVIYLPVGPSYLYYDYPYYYSRGYYPTHVGPHYIYYGPGYVYYGLVPTDAIMMTPVTKVFPILRKSAVLAVSGLSNGILVFTRPMADIGGFALTSADPVGGLDL